MNTPNPTLEKVNQTDTLVKNGKIKIRNLSPQEMEEELRRCVAEIQIAIAQLEKAQIVTQDTLQLEFTI
jgi:hypothetical protein